MDKLIFTAMTGAKHAQQRQDTIAQNIANVSTGGYRAAMVAARAVPVQGQGAQTRTFALEATTGADLTPGVMQRTGRELDVAMEGNAWLTVQGRDGREAYTRAGALRVDANGALLGPGGKPVMGEGGPLAIPPDSTISIAPDGTVSAIPDNGTLAAVVNVGRIKLVTLDAKQAQRGDDGLFRTANGQPAPADANARLASGALESSNVNPAEAMVSMIGVARHFELQMRLLTTAENNARSAAQLLSVTN
jgi:flagellar basal-body rod protein FlgF